MEEPQQATVKNTPITETCLSTKSPAFCHLVFSCIPVSIFPSPPPPPSSSSSFIYAGINFTIYYFLGMFSSVIPLSFCCFHFFFFPFFHVLLFVYCRAISFPTYSSCVFGVLLSTFMVILLQIKSLKNS